METRDLKRTRVFVFHIREMKTLIITIKSSNDELTTETISNKDIIKYYETQQEKNEQYMEKRKQGVYNKIPDIKDLDQQITTLSIQISKCVLNQDKNMDSYKKQVDQLKSKKTELLLENDYPKDYLELKYNCPKCQDKGILDTGKRCDCYKDILEKRG